MTLLSAALLVLAQADWTRFRGPTGDGIAAADAAPPLAWSETKNVAWKTPLPGRGRSSPVLQGNRLYVTRAVERGVQRKKIGPDDMQTAEHVELGAACLDRETGAVLWDVNLRAVDGPDPVHWFNSWATPTPVVEGARLWCDFGGMGTWCLDISSGRVVWEKTIPLDHQVGPGSSLLLDEGRLVMVRDGRREQHVTALDKATGETVWRTERPPVQASSGNAKKSFSTPILVQAGGRRQLVASGPHWIVAYDPASGKELWRIRHGDGFSIGSVPVAGGDVVYFSSGCMRPNLLAVRCDGLGDVTSTHLAWRSQKGIPVMSSPLLSDGRLYYASDDGIATCADAGSGTAIWQERLGEGHLASPILAAGRIYFFGREGKTLVVKAAGALEKLAENKLDGVQIASPAAVGKALYVRTDTHVYRLEQRE
jgi:outer membrane protein assembly factor BamB